MDRKKICFLFIVALGWFFSFNSYGLASDDLKLAAIKKLQQSFIKTLPVESNIARLAVLDLEGDDGTLREAITTAITEKTNFKVIERKDLDKILEEQGLQLKDVMDEKTRIQHGKIRGVQGLLLGKVLENKSGFMSYSLKVQLKLDDVEKGEIVFSKDFNISVASPVRNWIFLGIAGLIILLIFIVWLKKRRVTVIETKIQEDVEERVDLTKEIGKALNNLSQAKAKLMDQGKTDEAVLIKSVERELQLLKDLIDNAPRGSADLRATKDFKQVVDFDKRMKELLENLTRRSDQVFNLVISGDLEGFNKEVEFLTKDNKNAINEFKNRGF